MQISFLLGAAGSGKTFRCLSEIRNELLRSPEGNPLILVAPKQATFQLERQLLEGDKLKGYSRLHIFSFERLARYLFEIAGEPVQEFLSEQGRIMVLRALLNRLERQLGAFGRAAQRQGFPPELAKQLREFSNHGLSPSGLRNLAETVTGRGNLRGKLQDFALIFEEYREWLSARSLRDSDALLGAAADLLTRREPLPLAIAGLWLDGFAQLTPEERRLLVALLRYCDQTTLAFCLDAHAYPQSPISIWYLVKQTVAKCQTDIRTKYGIEPTVVALERNSVSSRFSASPGLKHLEATWGSNLLCAETPPAPAEAVKIFECADPEAEATCCAREIVHFVRKGGRFREAAVLLRDFDGDYGHVLQRVFRRYEIPFFLDHRESVAHHPAAELTRGALRTVAYDWEQEDWFSVLKSGLIGLAVDELDYIETLALKHGWKGSAWREESTGFKNKPLEADFNRWKARIIPPFLRLRTALQDRTSGPQMAGALRKLWKELGLEEQLQDWAGRSAEDAVHSTVWEQMGNWLGDVERAFTEQALSLRQWLPILEAGLGSLTVGVIPPVLDEVVLGAVARSRNPDLKLLCVLGFNEKVFPAVPGRDTLLTEEDRLALLAAGSELADSPALQLSAEQFYGYIACTRAREALRITYARSGLDGKALNASRFISQLRLIFPELKPEAWDYPQDLDGVVHRSELPMLGFSGEKTLSAPDRNEVLEVESVRRLYGERLEVPVSALERFASCPFRFFVERGLRVQEREEFALDIREQGKFQHLVLQRFHEEVTRSGRQWRELSPPQARALISRLADEEMATFHEGLLLATRENQFTGESYKAALQDFIEAIIGWFKTNHFDPTAVEFAFGGKSELPGWPVQLSNGKAIVIHGRVDRIDVHKDDSGEALCVIMDYKSGLQEPKRILTDHGIQQQLTAYLAAVTKVPEIAASLGEKSLRPVGAFIVRLRPQFEKANTRLEVAEDEVSARATAYTHVGLFNGDYVKKLDAAAAADRTGQFRMSLKGKAFNLMSRERFAALLDRAEVLIAEIGTRIFEGEISVHPFKGAGQVACKNCQLLSVCRFDPWTQRFNKLTRESAS